MENFRPSSRTKSLGRGNSRRIAQEAVGIFADFLKQFHLLKDVSDINDLGLQNKGVKKGLQTKV